MKHLTYCLTLFFICNCIVASFDKELLYNQISALSREFPEDCGSYFSEASCHGKLIVEKFSIDQVEDKLNEFGFTDFIKNKLRGALLASSQTFQSFSLVVSPSIGSLEEVIGYAKNTNNHVELVFIDTRATGKLEPKYDIVTESVCVQVLFWQQCHPEERLIPRGYLTWELNQIEEILRAISYKHLRKTLDEKLNENFLADMSEFSINNNTINSNTDYSILSIEQSNQNIFKKAIDGILTSFPMNIYINQFGKNIRQIVKSINVQNFELKTYEDQIQFSKFFCANLQYSQENCNDWFNQLLKVNLDTVSNKKEPTKSIFRICLLSNNQLEFSEILVSYYEDNINKGNYFEVELKHLKQTINSTKKFLFIKSGGDEDYYQLNTNVKINFDEKVLLNLIEVMFQVEEEKELLTTIKLGTNSVSFLQDSQSSTDYLTKALNAVVNSWSTMVSAFKTTRSVELKEKLIQEGFTKFDQSAHIQVLKGLRIEGLDCFIDLMQKRLNVPEDKRGNVKMILEEVQWTEKNLWANFDIAFSIGQEGMIKYASIFSNKDENNNFNFLITEIQATLQLAPDILIMTEKKSILGGAWSDSKDRINFVPKSLTTDDVKVVFSFFQLIVYKQVANQFGIKLELPNK